LTFVLVRQADHAWWYVEDPDTWRETTAPSAAYPFRAQACACEEAFFLIEPALPGWVWTRYVPFGTD
jgi:hypothetical protein